ncbi:hypothetical protein [Xanthovirga aplysinae]|uniref:hypothetical protein n=1 Tax=Xanthovirga aplysinae TaxID=2529853 RepID=UPI0012BCA307|nr:hypothetical protein [Xanthovirga aplysinae]MTI33496.1 hypothetical protein [Xanthovirga aplysinae]
MKNCFLSFIIVLGQLSPVFAQDTQSLRKIFYESKESKKAAKNFQTITKEYKMGVPPIFLAYKGMANFLMAKHANNPFKKLSYFRQGKIYLEESLQLDSLNPEIIFLRFTVQTSTPPFLGYSNQIQTDKTKLLKYLTASKTKFQDPDLFQRILDFLSQSNFCTTEEQNQLNQLKP